MHDHGLIRTPAALDQLLQALHGSDWLAIDTEFVREQTYFAQLGLIQIATRQHMACLDPLALPDLTPLVTFLEDPQVIKVFHAGTQDLEVLEQHLGVWPSPLFDTQVAASLLGIAHQAGYARLVEQLLQESLDKSQTRTDWIRRPLSPEQLRYARQDVQFLAPLYEHLHAQLLHQERLPWMQEEMDALRQTLSTPADPQAAWQKISGWTHLSRQGRAVLQAVAAWRETEARAGNRPRRWLLPDHALLHIAQHPPADQEALLNLRAVPRQLRPNQISGLLQAIQYTLDQPPETWPAPLRPLPPTEQEEQLLQEGQTLLQQLAQEQRVCAEILASRRDMLHFIRGENAGRLHQGWRAQLAGTVLQHRLRGLAH